MGGGEAGGRHHRGNDNEQFGGVEDGKFSSPLWFGTVREHVPPKLVGWNLFLALLTENISIVYCTLVTTNKIQ